MWSDDSESGSDGNAEDADMLENDDRFASAIAERILNRTLPGQANKSTLPAALFGKGFGKLALQDVENEGLHALPPAIPRRSLKRRHDEHMLEEYVISSTAVSSVPTI